jgi:hypothetical protein
MLSETKMLSVRKRRMKIVLKSLIISIFFLLALIVFKTVVNNLIFTFDLPFKFEVIESLIDFTFIFVLIFTIVLLIGILIFILFDGGYFSHHNIILAFRYFSLKNRIDKAFINTSTYNVLKNLADDKRLAETPKVKVIDDLTLFIENLTGTTEKLERFKVHLSSLLKNGVVCEVFELNMTQDYYIAKLIDLSAENQIVIKNHHEFINFIKDTKTYEIKLMPNFVKDVSKSPHLLIAGETGSGKSYLLYFIIFQLILKECEIYLIDRKKVLTKFSKFVVNGGVADTEDEIFELLHRVEYEMDQRENFLKQNYPNDIDVDFTFTDYVPIFLVIDELGSLVSELESKKQKEFYKLLQSIGQRGRSSGINIIVSMQQPNASDLPTAIRDQLTFKAVLGNTDSTTRQLVFKANDLMNINFKKGQGYFTNSGTHNKASILFVPTFKFTLDLLNLSELIDLYKRKEFEEVSMVPERSEDKKLTR